MYVVPKQLRLKDVLMVVASVLCDFWVTGPISYKTDLGQLSRNTHDEAVTRIWNMDMLNVWPGLPVGTAQI